MAIDIIIILIMLFSVYAGVRKGFSATVFHTCGWLVAVIAAIVFSSQIRNLISERTALYDNIKMSVTKKIQDSAATSVNDLLPLPDGVSDFLSNTVNILSTPVINTIASFIYYVVCFLFSVAVIKIILFVIIRLFSKKYAGGIRGFADSLTGGIIGVIRGTVLLLLVLALLFPAVSLVSDSFSDTIVSSLENSQLAFYIYKNNPFIEIITNMSDMYITNLLGR